MTRNTTLPVIDVESVRTSDELLTSFASRPRPPFSNGPEFGCLVCTSGLGLSSDQPKNEPHQQAECFTIYLYLEPQFRLRTMIGSEKCR